MDRNAENGEENRVNYGVLFKSNEADAVEVFEFIESLPSTWIVYRTRSSNRLWIRREQGVRMDNDRSY